MNVTFTVAPITSESAQWGTITYGAVNGTFLGIENNGHDIEYNYEWDNNRRPILVNHKHKTTTWTIKLLYTADNKKDLEDLISKDMAKMSYARNEVEYYDGSNYDYLVIKGVLKDVSTEYIGPQTAKVEYTIEGERVEHLTADTFGEETITWTAPGNADTPIRLEIIPSASRVTSSVTIGDTTYTLIAPPTSGVYIDGYSGKIARDSDDTDFSAYYTATRDGEEVNELPHIKGGETVTLTGVNVAQFTIRTEGRWL